MREYSYKEIQCFHEDGILFKDGYYLYFEACRQEWAKRKKIPAEETVCVAERDVTAEIPYFLFYGKEEVMVKFDFGFFFKKRKRSKAFGELREFIRKCEFTTYDLS